MPPSPRGLGSGRRRVSFRNTRSWISIGDFVTSDRWFTPLSITRDNETLSRVMQAPRRPWRPSVEGEARRPVSRRGKLDQRQKEDVAGLDRFALLLLACQPCQPCQTQLVMHPNQRVHLRSLLMIDQCHLSAPRPIRRMAPLEKPSVSTPIRWRPSLPHRGRNDAGLGSAGRRDPLYESAALRSQFDTSQRFQRPNCTRARVLASRNSRNEGMVRCYGSFSSDVGQGLLYRSTHIHLGEMALVFL